MFLTWHGLLRDLKDLIRTAAFYKAFCDRGFNIIKNLKHNEYQRGIASIVYKCFDKYAHLLKTIFRVMILVICN